MALRRNLMIGLVVLSGLVGLGLGTSGVVPWPTAGKTLGYERPAGVSSAVPADRVTRTILAYLEDSWSDDPLIEVQSGVWVKSSNYYGVTIAGAVYYYAMTSHQSFDPLSRGVVTLDAVEIVREIHDGEFTVIIYTIPGLATDA
jgi:hypothetical protein